jgi:hypothetical protein
MYTLLVLYYTEKGRKHTYFKIICIDVSKAPVSFIHLLCECLIKARKKFCSSFDERQSERERESRNIFYAGK